MQLAGIASQATEPNAWPSKPQKRVVQTADQMGGGPHSPAQQTSSVSLIPPKATPIDFCSNNEDCLNNAAPPSSHPAADSVEPATPPVLHSRAMRLPRASQHMHLTCPSQVPVHVSANAALRDSSSSSSLATVQPAAEPSMQPPIGSLASIYKEMLALGEQAKLDAACLRSHKKMLKSMMKGPLKRSTGRAAKRDNAACMASMSIEEAQRRLNQRQQDVDMISLYERGLKASLDSLE